MRNTENDAYSMVTMIMELDKTNSFKENMTEKDYIEKCLRESLISAEDDNRLVIGMSACATTMDEDPESVMMCLVPDDALGPLFMILARSGCSNIGVPLAVVNSHEKLAKFLNIDEMRYGILDCIVIKRPQSMSYAERELEEYILKDGTEEDVHLPWT